MSDKPITALEARELFAEFATAPALVLAVSGGPDSTALMWLAARWRRGRRKGPKLVVATVDHGLRPDSRREASDVKRLATELGLTHLTKRWRGDKPATGLPAAARAARYRLLGDVARASGARHVMTAHTLDDQAETVLMRLVKGSGLAGLAAMRQRSSVSGFELVRPLLDVPKSRLVATLEAANIDFSTDPGNADPAFLRPRLRALLPALAAEGCDARNLARLSSRMARAEAALERLVDGAESYLALRHGHPAEAGIDPRTFAALPDEVRIRLLLRVINRIGHEGPAELGKVEALAAALAQADACEPNGAIRLKRTLAGAVVSLTEKALRIAPAPPRRPLRRDLDR